MWPFYRHSACCKHPKPHTEKQSRTYNNVPMLECIVDLFARTVKKQCQLSSRFVSKAVNYFVVSSICQACNYVWSMLYGQVIVIYDSQIITLEWNITKLLSIMSRSLSFKIRIIQDYFIACRVKVFSALIYWFCV